MNEQQQHPSIACGECGGGVRLRYKGSTRTHHIYRCPFGHVFSQPIVAGKRIIVQFGNSNPPPKDAA